ncbi:hypothetical protein [Aeromonas media]|uniref:hypothetical protein n=1 Tax=Aeromonas media TaxID=651 RepID=UPI00130DF98D|nr:hypothetical protein [Aeromonas media]
MGFIEPLLSPYSFMRRTTREPHLVLDGILLLSTPGHLGETYLSVLVHGYRSITPSGGGRALAKSMPSRKKLKLHLNKEALIDFDLLCLDGSNASTPKDAIGEQKKH